MYFCIAFNNHNVIFWLNPLQNSLKNQVKVTPLMSQYFKLKAKHPDAILLFRVGDFYETFSDDAVKPLMCSESFSQKRNNGGIDIELAGFPYHSLDVYLPKLVRAGYRIAICEQLEKPSKEKKWSNVASRMSSRRIAIEENILDRKSNNYLASIIFQKESTD